MSLYDKSIGIIKQYQSENGAYIASPAFSQYGFCWLRDGSFIAEAMAEAGEIESARKFFKWVEMVLENNWEQIAKVIQKDKSTLSINDFLPTRYKLNGERNLDNWENAQSDGYGTYLWSLDKFVKITDYEINREVTELITAYVEKVWNIPCYDAWEEEKNAIHTSTLISITAGLKAAEELLGRKTKWQEIKNHIEKKHVFEGRLIKSTLNNGVDSSLIWAVSPYSLWEPNHPLIKNTIKKIEEDLLFDGGLKRYMKDSYFGGGSWILLSANLALYYKEIKQEDKFKTIKNWIELHADKESNLPEQINEHLLFNDYYDKWLEKWGEIANPLLWSHANYLKIAR